VRFVAYFYRSMLCHSTSFKLLDYSLNDLSWFIHECHLGWFSPQKLIEDAYKFHDKLRKKNYNRQ